MSVKEKGKIGEDFACDYLMKLGYEIVERNFHSRFGEVDIVAQNDEYMVFAEVKARQYNAMVSGRAAVDFRKQKKIVKTAAIYLLDYNYELQPRFDVIEVHLSGDRVCGIDHIEGAFTADGILY